MKILKGLLAYIRHRLPVLLLMACVVSFTVTGALYAKYVKDVDKDVTVDVVSDGDVEIEITLNSAGEYSIQHTSNSKIPAYIRFTVITNWKNTATDELWYLNPESVTVTAPCAQQLSDGYYYAVVDGKAEIALNTVLSGITVTTTQTAPAGYELSVEILAEAIQCMPASAVEDAWGATFNGTTWSKN